MNKTILVLCLLLLPAGSSSADDCCLLDRIKKLEERIEKLEKEDSGIQFFSSTETVKWPQVNVSVYYCLICGKTFLKKGTNLSVSCAVNHSPGTCCHYSEEEVR